MDGSETGRTTAAQLRRHPAWTAAAAALLAVLPFLPSLGYGFLVEWDDGGFVLSTFRRAAAVLVDTLMPR